MRFSRACLVAVLLACQLRAGCATAHAASLDEALAHFTADDFSETIDRHPATSPQAAARAPKPSFAPCRTASLLFSAERKAVYIKDDAGTLTDAATGQPASGDAPADLDNVRLNNRLRGAIDAALGGLTLLSPAIPAPATRPRRPCSSRATRARCRRSRPPSPRRRDPRDQARAVGGARRGHLVRDKASDDDKLAAVDVIRQRADQDALGTALEPAGATPRRRSQRPPQPRSAPSRTVSPLWEAVQNVWYGLSLGSVLLLAAIGLAITFGVMGVINMAHGEMVMLGAYTTFVVQEVIRSTTTRRCSTIRWPSPFRSPSWSPACIGILIERSIIRFLYGRPLETLLATWGLSLILQQAVRTIFGPTNREVGTPSWMTGAFELGGITITYNRLWIIVLCTRGLRRAAGAAALHPLRPARCAR